MGTSHTEDVSGPQIQQLRYNQPLETCELVLGHYMHGAGAGLHVDASGGIAVPLGAVESPDAGPHNSAFSSYQPTT